VWLPVLSWHLHPDAVVPLTHAREQGGRAGRLILTTVGFWGSPRALLVMTITLLAGVFLVCAAILRDGRLLSQPAVLAPLIVFGSICGTYAQGLLAAILQQQVAEDFRGRLGSVVVAGRSALISLGVSVGALVAGAGTPCCCSWSSAACSSWSSQRRAGSP